MSSIIDQARHGVVGCFKMLAFREDWRSHFDVSSAGVARSFAGVVLALPAFIFCVFSINHLVAESPNVTAADAGFDLSKAVLVWARFWLLFPLIAAVAAMVLNVNDRYGKWLVVHNWMVFVLIHIQAFCFALYMAGLADGAALASLLMLYQLARLLVHWRVAAEALDLPVVMAAAAAAIPLLVERIVIHLMA